MFSLAVCWVKDSDVVELLCAVRLVARRVCVTQSITPGELSLGSTEQLASGSHTAVVVIKSHFHVLELSVFVEVSNKDFLLIEFSFVIWLCG